MKLLRKVFAFPIAVLYSNVRIVNERSYYPDLPRKSWLRRWLDCAIIRWEDGWHAQFYNYEISLMQAVHGGLKDKFAT